MYFKHQTTGRLIHATSDKIVYVDPFKTNLLPVNSSQATITVFNAKDVKHFDLLEQICTPLSETEWRTEVGKIINSVCE